MSQKKYDSTVARIAGNILSGRDPTLTVDSDRVAIRWAVYMAREIVAEVERTEPPRAENVKENAIRHGQEPTP